MNKVIRSMVNYLKEDSIKEIEGNIWDYHKQGHWIVITTNSFVKKDGACVMGRGVALQAKLKFPSLPYHLGDYIKKFGNHVTLQPDCHIFTFPVKHNWWEKADLELIEQSCEELVDVADAFVPPFYMVRPGCGNGKLNWKDVKSILEKYLDDRFIVVEQRKK